MQPASPLLVAIDGRCGSGKSTLAVRLSRHFEGKAAVYHMDDFFLPPALRTAERLQEPGGNVHYERFFQEVLQPLKKGISFSYGKYSCQSGDMITTQASPAPLAIVEGVYSLHPLLQPSYDYKVFLTVDPQTQKDRLQQRSGDQMLQRFLTEWIPLEEAYFRAFSIPVACDIQLKGSHI